MLLGEVSYKMGQKHRLAIPKKFREELGDTVIISRGYEGCLIIVSQAQWQHLIQPVSQGSMLDANTRASARFLMGGAHQLVLDSQGRTIIPENLFEFAQLQDEVIFVGLGQWVEVWSSQRWQKQLDGLQHQAGALAQQLISSDNSNTLQ